MIEQNAKDLAREMVRDYLDHLEEREHVAKAFELLGVEGVLELLADMVIHGDPEEVADATLFVRDVFLIMPPPGFRQAYNRSALVRALQARLLDASPSIRTSCIYTLGKTCHRPSARHLDAAFPWYLENAPLELNSLLSELSWLGGAGRPYAYHLRRMTAAPLYLTRWAAVGLVGDGDVGDRRSGRLHGQEKQALRRLAQDPHPWVRTQARWALDIRRDGPPHHGREAHLQRRAAGPPVLRFDALTTLVSTYLEVSGGYGYDAELCTALGQYVRAHPISHGWDPAVYWQPLIESRRRFRETRGGT